MNELKKTRKQEIEKSVTKVLSSADASGTPYVDIVAIVKKEGFEVEPTELDIETTGCLLVNDDKKIKKRVILVNTQFKNPDNEEDVVFKKSRFITAHEYAHFVLHKREGESIYAHRDTYHRCDLEEQEADYFARSILMPFEQFKIYYEFFNQMGKNDKEFTELMLSKMFKVTRNKVNKRIGDLLTLG